MNMKKMNGIQRFIQLIDSKADAWRHLDDGLSGEIKFIQEGLDPTALAILELESKVMSSKLEGSQLKPKYVECNDGNEFSWPDLSQLTESDYTYLQKRATTSPNPYLRLKYNLALWNGPKHLKRKEQAKEAIDALIILLNSYQPTHDPVRIALDYLRCSASLCEQIRDYRSQEITDIPKAWVSTWPQDMFSIEHIIRLVIQFQKVWPPASLDWSYSLLEVKILGMVHNHGIMIVDRIAELGAKLAQKLGKDQRWWYEQAGECHENFSAERMGDLSNMGKLRQFGLAMEWFEKAGNEEKFERAKIKYEAMRKELKMDSFIWRLPNQYAEVLDASLQSHLFGLQQQGIYSALDYFATDDGAFQVMKSASEPPFTDPFNVFKILELDRNMNVREAQSETVDEKEVHDFLFFFELYPMAVFSTYFSESITSGEITKTQLLKWVKQSTWYGKRLTKNDGTGAKKKYTWITSIASSIEAFFAQKRKKRPNYVAAIDSLTLKIEGILREIAERNLSTTTSTIKKGEIKEALFDALLIELKGVLKPEDLLFLKAGFTSKGKNIRNNVAHCFVLGEDYSKRYFYMVLWMVMRLGKYDVQ
jgi:hypothetical protein